MNLVILGLTITSSWGNGHATTYRSLVGELGKRGHNVLFLECDKPWYAENRDLPKPGFCRLELYKDLSDLKQRFQEPVEAADAVLIGSYVPDGIGVSKWLLDTATGPVLFYDIDTPITLEHLHAGHCQYLSRDLVPRFDAYLSFSGGPVLDELADAFGAVRTVPFHCSFDPEIYYPEHHPWEWDLGYLGTYSPDRQSGLERLLVKPAQDSPDRRFVVAGPLYPKELRWPHNVERIEHLSPDRHRTFYNSQRFTLNLTRQAMVSAGYSPSVRLFEAAACGIPIISDYWAGLETFFKPGVEILLAESAQDVTAILNELGEDERRQIGQRALRRVTAEHTAAHRADQLEWIIQCILNPFGSVPFPHPEVIL